MVLRRFAVVLAVAAAVVLTGTTALAEPPVDVVGQVDDRADVLSDDEQSAVEDALEQLQVDEDIELVVVFVDSFDGLDRRTWADESATASGLDSTDVLLAVAVEDREYGYALGSDVDVTEDEVDEFAASDVEPLFGDGDWAGGAEQFAEGLAEANGTDYGTVAVVGGLIALGGGAYVVTRVRRKRRQAAAPEVTRLERPDPHAGVPTDQLQARASTALLELDEAIKTSQLDLDFARLQYGEDAVTGFGEALAQSRDELTRAFTLRQQLDDEVPEDEPTTRAMLADMLALTAAADARLDSQAEEFDQLRDLEKNAPQALEALGPRITALHGRLPADEQRMAELQRRYAPAAIAPVADNLEQARARLAAAEQEVTEARTALDSGRPGEAVGDLRAAEDAVVQTGQLLDAIGRLAADLESAVQRIPAARADTEQDLAEARALVASGDRSGLQPQIARAEAAIGASDEAMAGAAGGPDPFTALRRLEEADIALEQALGAARDAQARAHRAAAALEQTLLNARSTIAAAGDFIATRRGAVGPEARTRLAEAERHLQAATGLAGTDPVGALQAAQQADALAAQALQRAQSDVSGWNSGYGGGGYGGGFGGGGFAGPGYGRGPDLGSLVLGGILLGGGGGGGYRGGSFGGSGRRSGSFGGGSRGGGGGRRGGGGRF
ncbi:TPM domain-containing protein [Trujillonella endophytica]|uniref:TLP18.3, Psb32 and MOLO-1 founding protein of phosphatase n=1 Tax=Trujillonella endophytica TaxID=673521 RepID=A0A1H8W9B1_9ACTN|nr:TPM domain-containing protein [Trujillella endophytica]SEP24255.1 TLP18.3, Psb32 and MOLO-1 founding protein of phosphatase [Trujillella endophytica]